MVTGVSQVTLASESNGTILNSYNLTKICKSIDCSSYGNVNWKPTLNANTTGATAVTITDSSVTGHLWGDEIGWVNLQPSGAGVIVNPNTGKLSGYAYANVGSWINFSPTSVSGGPQVGVSINSQGHFTGWAYVSGINGGWMKFDCSDSSTCIKTEWRPVPNRSIVSSTPPSTPSNSSVSSSGGGSTPERRAADLAAIWAYNNLLALSSPTLPGANESANNPSGQLTVQQRNNSMPENTTSFTVGSDAGKHDASSTVVTSENSTKQGIQLLQTIFKSPATKIIGIIILLGLLWFLARILL